MKCVPLLLYTTYTSIESNYVLWKQNERRNWRKKNKRNKRKNTTERKEMKIEFSFGGMKVFRKGIMQNDNRNSFPFFHSFSLLASILRLKCLSFSLVSPGITFNNFSIIVR